VFGGRERPVTEFRLKRFGMIMEPRPGDPNEVEGVLNPAAARSLDGQLYLFPRLVARGNYSRIGIARVLFNSAGDPKGVERMGIVLEPEADYELSEQGGGCEDPRISFVEPLQHYVMTYTALSRRGPRIAIAISDDLFRWRRMGLATFHPYDGIAFDGVDDKDASVFPTLIPGPLGRPVVALLHRPLFPGTRPEEKVRRPRSHATDPHRESIWISYCRVGAKGEEHRLGEFVAHHPLASPLAAWEQLKIGGGAPPVMCRHGWLVIYHGVHKLADEQAVSEGQTVRPKMAYSAGAMVLSREHPNRIVYRSWEPVLVPSGPLECHGIVDDVVFPTGIDRRDDLGAPDRFDVYYGMADDRIGVARLDVPPTLPRDGAVDVADAMTSAAPSPGDGVL
jgi:beta-1,2-mannobiose phosphorylase / 1,2-beta-oligomannan phosphorylase